MGSRISPSARIHLLRAFQRQSAAQAAIEGSAGDDQPGEDVASAMDDRMSDGRSLGVRQRAGLRACAGGLARARRWPCAGRPNE